MAFSASGTNYTGFLDQRRLADNQLTQAQDAKGRADKRKRIKESGKRSGVQKLLSAAARGAAAYYTGGLSEQYGGGEMIDSAMLGTDSEGNAVKNEYGDLAALGSAVYQGSKSQKAQKLAGADATFDKQYGRRKDNVNTLREQGQFKDAQLAQESLDNWENTYLQNKDKLSESGFLGTNIGIKDSEYSGLTSGMTNEEMSAKKESLNKERSDSIMQGKKEADRIQRDKDALHYQEQARTRANKSYIKPPSQKQASMSPNQEELITSINQGYIKPSISPADYKVQPSNYNVMAHRGADAIGPTALNLVEKEKLRLEEEQKEYLKRINEGGR
tara:strand:+ start:25 stop:1014 length:990 start_codon:yes stop_codon:yes gene_type:complete